MAKKSKIEKNFWHIDKRKEDKLSRKDFKKYVEWFHQQKFKCLECGTELNIEAHHIDSQDNRTIVPFCSYCHRGDEREGRNILSEEDIALNDLKNVSKGFYMHRGSNSKLFKSIYTDEKLLEIASGLYEKYLKENKA